MWGENLGFGIRIADFVFVSGLIIDYTSHSLTVGLPPLHKIRNPQFHIRNLNSS